MQQAIIRVWYVVLQEHRYPRRVKYLSRRYEMPTVASQMKQSAMRYYYDNSNNNNYNIPFIITKSCAPSHNIGVNIQQASVKFDCEHDGWQITLQTSAFMLRYSSLHTFRPLTYIVNVFLIMEINPTFCFSLTNSLFSGFKRLKSPAAIIRYNTVDDSTSYG